MPTVIRTAPCPLCRDSAEPGWLCEEHKGMPWQHHGCGAAGMPCVCNPTGQVRWAEVIACDELAPSDTLLE
jgi:hypothetical protein